jgi:hypothetical protein
MFYLIRKLFTSQYKLNQERFIYHKCKKYIKVEVQSTKSDLKYKSILKSFFLTLYIYRVSIVTDLVKLVNTFHLRWNGIISLRVQVS